MFAAVAASRPGSLAGIAFGVDADEGNCGAGCGVGIGGWAFGLSSCALQSVVLGVNAARHASWMKSASVGPSDHPIHFCFSRLDSVEGSGANIRSEDDCEVLFVVHVILVEVEEHFGASYGGYAGADDAIDFREDIEEFRTGFVGGIDGYGLRFALCCWCSCAWSSGWGEGGAEEIRRR